MLDNVQKFNYLHTHLVDKASYAISGFTLTSANYEEAIVLLQEYLGTLTK